MVMNMGVFRAIGSAIGVPIYINIGLTTNMVIAAIANVIAIALMVHWVKEQPAPATEVEA